MSITMAQGRVAVAHLRDELGLSNRELASIFRDQISADDFINFMNGDDSAITPAQSNVIGNELARYVEAEDLDRERTKRMGFTPGPGFREAMGLKG